MQRKQCRVKTESSETQMLLMPFKHRKSHCTDTARTSFFHSRLCGIHAWNFIPFNSADCELTQFLSPNGLNSKYDRMMEAIQGSSSECEVRLTKAGDANSAGLCTYTQGGCHCATLPQPTDSCLAADLPCWLSRALSAFETGHPLHRLLSCVSHTSGTPVHCEVATNRLASRGSIWDNQDDHEIFAYYPQHLSSTSVERPGLFGLAQEERTNRLDPLPFRICDVRLHRALNSYQAEADRCAANVKLTGCSSCTDTDGHVFDETLPFSTPGPASAWPFHDG